MSDRQAGRATGVKKTEVWIKLEGVLSEKLDPPSRWAIGAKTKHADEVMALARAVAEDNNRVTVYADAAESPRGQRAVQRWLLANDLYAWVSFDRTPPKGVEVIDRWPMSSTSN